MPGIYDNMANILKKLTEDTLSPPVRHRARLAHILISSLDKEPQQDVDNAWDAELERRIQDILNGKVKGIPAEEVFAKLREKYR